MALLATSAFAQQMICYDTEHGRVCGDSVPPEDAHYDRVIINAQGVVVREEQGEITPEEQAELDEQQRLEEQKLREAEERRRYGQILLDSYTSVESIEQFRDRILEQIDGQSAVIELYLSNFNNKLVELEKRAQRFAPYSDKEDAPPLPDNLALDLERTRSSIEQFQQRLEQSYKNYSETEAKFEQDIAYYRQLKGFGA